MVNVSLAALGSRLNSVAVRFPFSIVCEATKNDNIPASKRPSSGTQTEVAVQTAVRAISLVLSLGHDGKVKHNQCCSREKTVHERHVSSPSLVDNAAVSRAYVRCCEHVSAES